MSNEARSICKYPINVIGATQIMMPANAKVLSVQAQCDELQLWALVWPGAAEEKRRFAVYGTGHYLPAACGEYIGTVQQHNGAFVWHVFDITEVQP
jgi:hypothetical protein